MVNRSKASVLSDGQTCSARRRIPRSTRPPPPAQDSVSNIVPSEVENQLVSRLGAWATLEVHDPVWMLAVKVAVRIYHLGLNPQPKVHPQVLHMTNQWG